MVCVKECAIVALGRMAVFFERVTVEIRCGRLILWFGYGRIVLRSGTSVAVPARFGCNPVGSGECILRGNWFAWRGASAESSRRG